MVVEEKELIGDMKKMYNKYPKHVFLVFPKNATMEEIIGGIKNVG